MGIQQQGIRVGRTDSRRKLVRGDRLHSARGDRMAAGIALREDYRRPAPILEKATRADYADLVAWETAKDIRKDGGNWFRVRTAPLVDPDLPRSAKRAWIALSSYARSDGVCFPSIASLAERMERDERNARRALSTLRAHGYITVRQRRGSSVYTLHPGGSAPRGERIAPPVDNKGESGNLGGNESPPLGERIAPPGGIHRPPGGNESPGLGGNESPPVLGEGTKSVEQEKNKRRAIARCAHAREGGFKKVENAGNGLIDEESPDVKSNRELARLAKEGKLSTEPTYAREDT